MFENASFFQRKPDRVRAFRLTAEGNVPVGHADEPWLKAAIAAKQISRGGPNWYVRDSTPNSVFTRAMYGGDWLLMHEDDGRIEGVTDERFRAMFDAYDPEEGN